MSCRGFLQSILKILNFFLALVGALIVLYSLWMLNQWFKRTPAPTPAPAPAEEEYTSAVGTLTGLPLLSQAMPMAEGQEIQMVATLSFVVDKATRLGWAVKLPTPWFIYAFLALGIIASFVTVIGHIAAETANSCCLCFYTVLLALLLILQAAGTATVFFDDHWREDLPDDPTGELDRVYNFIAQNFDLLKWAALALLIVQGLALLVSLILRAVSGSRRSGYDSDDDYLPTTQRQAIQRQTTNAGNGGGGDSSSDNRRGGAKSRDEWSKRMREKYGLDTTEFTYNPSESRRLTQANTPAPPGEEKKGCCSIM